MSERRIQYQAVVDQVLGQLRMSEVEVEDPAAVIAAEIDDSVRETALALRDDLRTAARDAAATARQNPDAMATYKGEQKGLNRAAKMVEEAFGLSQATE